jgi:hypothetical protein
LRGGDHRAGGEGDVDAYIDAAQRSGIDGVQATAISSRLSTCTATRL